jgi:hypothetical protein
MAWTESTMTDDHLEHRRLAQRPPVPRLQLLDVQGNGQQVLPLTKVAVVRCQQGEQLQRNVTCVSELNKVSIRDSFQVRVRKKGHEFFVCCTFILQTIQTTTEGNWNNVGRQNSIKMRRINELNTFSGFYSSQSKEKENKTERYT